MNEMEFLNGGVNELQIMLNDINAREESIQRVNTIANEGKKLEKIQQQEQDNLNRDVNAALKSELAKATAEEDRIISDNTRKIKEVRGNRNKAKDRGVKERIENETRSLVEENRDLHRLIRKNFKENSLPSYCDTKWFYALYCTQGALDWIVKILVFLMGLVVTPYIVVELVNPWWFLKIILWAVIIVVFLAIYMTIYLLTKDRDTGILEEMRGNRYKIQDNAKEIRKIKKGIKNDTDESYYNLNDFDEEIEALQNNIEQTTKAREEKLKDFEENRKQKIIQQVNEAHSEALEKIKNDIASKSGEYNQAVEKANELKRMVAEKYEQYLTPQFTNVQSGQRMMEMIQNGQVSNIGQALQMLKQ